LTDLIPLAIKIVSGIVDRVLTETNPKKIISAVQQILSFWNFIPDDLKQKCFWIFHKIWDKRFIVFSTKREIPNLLLGETFMDAQMQRIFRCISEPDASAFYLGVCMRELISRGQHEESNKIKQSILLRYPDRGLPIANLITTNDITYVIEDVGENQEKDLVRKVFEEWVNNYRNIAVLIHAEDVKDVALIESKVIVATKSLKKKFIIINMTSNSIETITDLVTIIKNMKTSQKLKFSEFKENISESGFYWAFKGIIYFD
jgi:hypothetical protein